MRLDVTGCRIEIFTYLGFYEGQIGGFFFFADDDTKLIAIITKVKQ